MYAPSLEVKNRSHVNCLKNSTSLCSRKPSEYDHALEMRYCLLFRIVEAPGGPLKCQPHLHRQMPHKSFRSSLYIDHTSLDKVQTRRGAFLFFKLLKASRLRMWRCITHSISSCESEVSLDSHSCWATKAPSRYSRFGSNSI